MQLADLDKTLPVVILTRELVRPHLARLTIAPITATFRGLSTEVVVGPANGFQQTSVISCDNIATIPTNELALAQAIRAAFDLE
ncbi:type II toxin-antitoxin system PemK/MazF family toxin [Mycobacterium riyadhense]|uniref:mRNA interferase MazF3 n=1 Tax=Mycobacterium riyadhense TaxID=486698 RepID=A0A1X2D838_9MYCO|nr:type II toxin-antitoxin system PemK/MazF family toxin [Mycobacterium riyadhense]MCV7148975.1 type II toxin-antitoxin system PemK/MazF family toxin [Mycobacterium riyadhense]ORW84251.1 mRNA interferase MazF3 [Mycobacterium riyadhense]